MGFLCHAAVMVLCWEVCFNKPIPYSSELIPSLPGATVNIGNSDDAVTMETTFDLCNLFESILVSSLMEAHNLSIQPSLRSSSAVDPRTLWRDYTEEVLSIIYFLGRQKRQETAGYNMNSFGLRFGKRDTKFNWNSFGLRFGRKRQLPTSVVKIHQMLCQG